MTLRTSIAELRLLHLQVIEILSDSLQRPWPFEKEEVHCPGSPRYHVLDVTLGTTIVWGFLIIPKPVTMFEMLGVHF